MAGVDGRKIQVSGMPTGHGIDRAAVQSTIEKYYDRLGMRISGEMFMEVHFKEAHTKGMREQVEAHTRVVVGGIVLHSKHVEWDAAKAVLATLKAIEKEAEKVIRRK